MLKAFHLWRKMMLLLFASYIDVMLVRVCDAVEKGMEGVHSELHYE